MALEIERRFLVDTDKLLLPQEGNIITQGYLSSPGDPFTIRARLSIGVYGRKLGFITLKNKIANGINKEFEYAIPPEDAEEIIGSCGTKVVTKKRYYIDRFEVDIFKGELSGIVIAEIELKDISEEFDKPEWLGREITYAKELSNFSMALNPELAIRIFNELKSDKKTP